MRINVYSEEILGFEPLAGQKKWGFFSLSVVTLWSTHVIRAAENTAFKGQEEQFKGKIFMMPVLKSSCECAQS